MSPEQQKLLNIYFNKMQQKVIFSNEIIKDNILNFIESYSSLNLSGLLENNDYKIIYPIRNALDFLATIKVKAKDNYTEKVNEAFEKLSVFDWKASENLIFTNLLLSEGKLPELLAKLAENLAMYPVEEIQVNQDVPLDFYESILAISTTHLTILANANFQGITQPNSGYRFRPKSAINHVPSAGQDVRKQPSPSPQGNNELGSSDSDAGISPQPTAGDQRPVESQTGNGAVTQTGDSTQKPSQSTQTAQGVFWNTGRLNPDDYPSIPLVVVDTANELFELLNEGRKGHEVFTEFMMQALPITYKTKTAQQKLGEVYVLKTLGLEGSLSNILDSNGVAINSPNWKRHYDTINEFEDYKTELIDAYKRQQQETAYLENARIEEVATQLEKEREAETILNGIYQLATNSMDVNAFLQTIRQKDSLNSETGKLVMQQLFQISDADSKEARLEKFNQWFSSYKTEPKKEAHNLATQKQEIVNHENAEPTLRANSGEVLGTARNESVQPIVYLERNGAVKPFYVSLDKEINTVFTLAMDRVRATNAILGVTLTESEKTALLDGKTVLLKGLVNSAASDKPFDALVTIDASKMALDFNRNMEGLSEKQAVSPNIQKEFVGITAPTNEQNMPSQAKTINK